MYGQGETGESEYGMSVGARYMSCEFIDNVKYRRVVTVNECIKVTKERGGVIICMGA